MKDPIAQAMAQKRWKKVGRRERSAIGKKLASVRWAGHVAKRPASARKKAKGKGKL
jgi:hypothetical protein